MSENNEDPITPETLAVHLTYVRKDVAEIKKMLQNGKFVTKTEFKPVQAIAFGLVTIALVKVVGDLLALVTATAN